MNDSRGVGFIRFGGTKYQLAVVLMRNGFDVEIGNWALELRDCGFRFKIAYVGNITPRNPFEIEFDGYNQPIEKVSEQCRRLSGVLKNANIPHNIVQYDEQDNPILEIEHKEG